jgi:hypothetical protein
MQHLLVTVDGSEPKCAQDKVVASNPQLTPEDKPETCQNMIEKYSRTARVVISLFLGYWNLL